MKRTPKLPPTESDEYEAIIANRTMDPLEIKEDFWESERWI